MGTAAETWKGGSRKPQVVPLLVFLLTVALMVGLWAMGLRHERMMIRYKTEVAAEQVARRIEAYFQTRIRLLQHLRWHWDQGRITDPDSFARWAEQIQQIFTGFQAINWVDPQGYIRWVTPEEPNRKARDKNIHDHPEAVETLEAAERTGEMQITPPLTLLQGGRGIAVYIPLEKDGRPEGFLNGVFRVAPAIEDCLRIGVKDRFFFRITDADKEIFTYGNASEIASSPFTVSQRVNIAGRTWGVHLSPKPRFVATSSRTHLDEIALVLGILLSAGLSWTLGLVQERQRRLLISQYRSRLVIEKVNDAITISQDDRLIFFNPHLTEMLGYEPAELQGVPSEKIFSARGFKILEDRRARRERGETVPSRYETFLQRKDGVEIPVEANVAVIDYNGRPATFGVIRDISERKRAEDQLRRREEYLACLTETDSVLLTARDMDAVLPQVLRRLREITSADRVAIYVNHHGDSGDLYASRRIESSSGSAGPRREPAGGPASFSWKDEGFKDWAETLESGKTILCRIEDLPEAAAERFRRAGVAAVVAAPLTRHGKWYGALFFENASADADWGEQEIQLARAAATAISGAADRARTDHEQMGLAQLAMRLTSAMMLEEILEIVREESCRLLQWDAYFLSLREPGGDRHRMVDRVDTIDGERRRFPGGTADEALVSPPLRRVRRGEDVLINRTLGDEQPKLSPFGRKDRPSASLLFVPIRSGSNVIGVLSAQSYTAFRYGPRHLEILRRIADTISPAIERICSEQARIRLATAVEQAAESIMITDTEAVIEYVNPAFERNSEHAGGEVLGRTPDFLAADPESRERLAEAWKTAAGGTTWKGRLVKKRKSGTIYQEECTVSPVRDGSGEIINLVFVGRDVTQEAKLEAQLRQAQKMEAIGTLAGGIAHDFNNLLTGVLGYSDLLKLTSKEGDPVHEAASVIERAAERAAQLTSQLLGFARGGKQHDIPVDLHETIREVSGLLQRTIDKRIAIRHELNAPCATVRSDPAQMEQVILNLALNARDAMPRGGEITFRTEAAYLEAEDCPRTQGCAPGPYLIVSVCDTGTGIAGSIRDRVFEPFFTTKEPGKGTGMGLAMVYGIVTNHGGFVTLTTEVGRGTTFRVHLPLLADPEQVPPADPVAPARIGAGRILLVDDEDVVRQVVSRMLIRLGYAVTALGSGPEAIELYRDDPSRFDLVILDMIMPEMGGFELFRALKALNPEIKAVLSTGYATQDAAQRVMAEGMAAFIQKPYESARLGRIIADVLGEARPARGPSASQSV